MSSTSPTPATAAPLQGAVHLPDWGVIRARGDDARSFLHGQLTQDVLHLAPGQARLAGLCSAKGRLLASFVMWADASGDILLACSADLLPQTLKRLRMYVLRAKCQLDDASETLPVTGLVGDVVPAAPAWSVQVEPGGACIRLPDVDATPRALWVGAEPPAAPALPIEAWRWLEARSAVPRITAATAEQFVPQMVNFEAVGGVSFSKGCYPGQEVVARSQYRGTLKRRAFVVRADTALAPGQEVFDAADPEQPAGMVVLTGTAPGEAPAALVSMKIAAAGARLHAGAPDGPALHVAALPYEIPAEPA